MKSPIQGDVRENIIRESTKLFLANGFQGTSVEEITKAARIGRGTLYWYFKSKGEVLESIFREFELKYVERLIEAVSRCEGDFVAKYKTFHKVATEFARDHRELALASNALLSEIVGTNTKTERMVKAIYEKYRSFVEGMLEEGKREGTVKRELDSAVYSHVIVASHAGMLVQWFVSGESLDIRAFVRTFRDLLLSGMIVDKAC